MFKLLTYSLKNSFARKLTSALTLFGIALVVFVFCAVFMLSNGLEKTLVATGSDDNVIIVRRSASTEIVSIVQREMADIIKADAAVAREADGTPMLATEILVLIGQPKRVSGEMSNIPVRGVSAMSLKIRPNVKITQGRMWHTGTSEIIAGSKVAKNIQGCGLGETVRFGMRDWTIVGLFEAGGSGFESELWGDVDQMAAAFARPVFSSLTFKLDPSVSFASAENRLKSDPRLTVDVLKEKEYYRLQSQTFTRFIVIMGSFISFIFAFGAIIGAMITMYASVSRRTVEIGTLRALGFGKSAIMTAFLFEAVALTVVGGAVGIVIAMFLQFLQISTTNFDTFAELAFSFKISVPIAISAMIFSVIMGILGGFLPAARAARMRIINALRAR